MKRGKYRLTGKTVCPYHKYSTASVIYCQGFFDNSSLAITFGNRDDKKEYQRRYCCKSGRRCMIASYLDQLIEHKRIFD